MVRSVYLRQAWAEMVLHPYWMYYDAVSQSGDVACGATRQAEVTGNGLHTHIHQLPVETISELHNYFKNSENWPISDRVTRNIAFLKIQNL